MGFELRLPPTPIPLRRLSAAHHASTQLDPPPRCAVLFTTSCSLHPVAAGRLPKVLVLFNVYIRKHHWLRAVCESSASGGLMRGHARYARPLMEKLADRPACCNRCSGWNAVWAVSKRGHEIAKLATSRCLGPSFSESPTPQVVKWWN